ncbi:MAG: mRNA interferase HigB [Gammaproteobacteria bacterium]|jgi:mRNA interferase HigB
MRIIARRTLRQFWERYPDSAQVLKAWFSETQAASWGDSHAIKRRYRHASFVGDNRIIFNVGGNKYRLIVHVNYGFGIVYIKFVGTHDEYDRIDPETV